MGKVYKVNPNDKDYFIHLYSIKLNGLESDSYETWANNEQDALDNVVNYVESKGWTGYFIDDNDPDVSEMKDNGVVITAGNYCRLLDTSYLVIREVK